MPQDKKAPDRRRCTAPAASSVASMIGIAEEEMDMDEMMNEFSFAMAPPKSAAAGSNGQEMTPSLPSPAKATKADMKLDSKLNSKSEGGAATPKKQGKAMVKKGFFKCWGCQKCKSKDLQDPASTKFDIECKKVADRLYAAARRQKKTPWLSVQLAHESTCVKVFKKYFDKMGDEGKIPKPGPLLAEIVEYMKAETSVNFDQRGVMMDLLDFIDFCKTRRGGNIQDPAEATMVFHRKCEEPDAILDDDGPGGSKQVCVKNANAKEVLFRHSLAEGKEVLVTGPPKRKASKEDIQKMQTSLQQDHQTIAKGDLTMTSFAQQMIKASSSSSSGQVFEDLNMKLGKLDEGLESPAPAEPDADGDDDDDEPDPDGEAEAPEQEQPPKKKQKWFDLDRANAAAIRMQDAWHTKVAMNAGEVYRECVALMNDFASLDPSIACKVDA